MPLLPLSSLTSWRSHILPPFPSFLLSPFLFVPSLSSSPLVSPLFPPSPLFHIPTLPVPYPSFSILFLPSPFPSPSSLLIYLHAPSLPCLLSFNLFFFLNFRPLTSWSAPALFTFPFLFPSYRFSPGSSIPFLHPLPRLFVPFCFLFFTVQLFPFTSRLLRFPFPPFPKLFRLLPCSSPLSHSRASSSHLLYPLYRLFIVFPFFIILIFPFVTRLLLLLLLPFVSVCLSSSLGFLFLSLLIFSWFPLGSLLVSS